MLHTYYVAIMKLNDNNEICIIKTRIIWNNKLNKKVCVFACVPDVSLAVV